MAKKKSEITVKITGPDCRLGDRLMLPGETVTIPADSANEWIREQRAVTIAVEVPNGDWPNA
jgi:predicted NUDIX family NTP pyrophosphohydrolase